MNETRPISPVRGAIRVIGIVGISFLALQSVFFTLLVAAQAVPDERIITRLEWAVNSGEYGPPYVPDGYGGIHDKFTECVIVGYGLGTTPEPMSLIERTAYAPRLASCEEGQNQILALAAGENIEVGTYARYWSGYSVLTRPALATLGLTGMRALTGAMLLGSAIFLTTVVKRRLGWLTTAVLFAPFAFTTNIFMSPGSASSHAISVAVIFLGLGALTLATARWGITGAAGTAAISAAVFNYVDLLTTPAIPWALSAFLAGAIIHTRERNWRPTLWAVIGVGAAWPAAFAATWASRWLIGFLVLGKEFVATVWETMLFRLDGTHESVLDEFGAATKRNVSAWWTMNSFNKLFFLILLAVLVGIVVVLIWRRSDRNLAAVPLLMLPAFVVPVWYEILSNHSQIHAFFTYRSIPVAIGIVAAALVFAARWDSDKQDT